MSRLGINTGSNPNDGQGDPLRVAMGKINSNFAEIYNSFGDGFSLISYASTAGISSVARNLTGSPRINVSGILNTGITTTEHIEVTNITSTGIITATQFVGDGSQLTNVTALVGGLEVLDDNVRKGVARELNFGDNIISSGPNNVGRVTISVTSTPFSEASGFADSANYAENSGLADVANYAEVSGISTNSLFATTSGSLTGSPDITVGVVTANLFVGDGSGIFNLNTTNVSYWILNNSGIHTFSNVGIGTTNPTIKLDVVGDGKFSGIVTATNFDSLQDIRVGFNTSYGLILTSPNGTKYRLVVDDIGVLSTVLVE
jgi:hypothetical protein